MQGLSERAYAARVGLSRGAIEKAKEAGRLVLFPDGSIDAEASDARRAEMTDPSKVRGERATTATPPVPKLKPVPEAAVTAVGDTLRENGLAAPVVGGGTTFLQAKTANEVLKAQERRIRLQKLKGEPRHLSARRDRKPPLLPRQCGDKAWSRQPVRHQPRLLQRLRHLCGRMPLWCYRDGSGGDLTGQCSEIPRLSVKARDICCILHRFVGPQLRKAR